jgi:hypothetical protein
MQVSIKPNHRLAKRFIVVSNWKVPGLKAVAIIRLICRSPNDFGKGLLTSHMAAVEQIPPKLKT